MIYRFRGFFVAIFLLYVLTFSPQCNNELWLLALVPAIVLRLWARCYIGSHSRQTKLDAPTLVQQGPYQIIRHPLYLSNIWMLLIILLWWMGISLHSVFLAIVAVAFYNFLARKEDVYLHSSFGQEWMDWLHAVPQRFIPRKRFSFSMKGAVQTWSQAFLSDRWTWIWLALGLVLSTVFKVHRCGY